MIKEFGYSESDGMPRVEQDIQECFDEETGDCAEYWDLEE